MNKKLFLFLIPLLFFIPKNTFAQSITPSYTQIYWQAYPYSDSSDVQNSAFESSQNQLYLWGSSFADFHLNRNGLLVTYPTLGASTYQYKVRFYIATNTNYIGLNKKASCNLWSSDIYNQSCSVDGSGITTDISGGGGYTTHYVDISYNFSTYGSNYVEFWIWYDNMKLTPKLTKFGYKILSFEGQIDPTSIIVDQNTTIINNSNKTNEKLDIAEETRQGIWETIKALPGKFLDMLKGLFIPDNFDFLDDFKETLETKLGFIAEVPIALIDFILGLVTANWSEFNSISFPAIEVFGVNFWGTQEISLQEAIDIFSPYKYVTDVICVVICVNTLKRWYDNFAGGGNS